MIRKNTVSVIFSMAIALALFMSLLLSPVDNHVYADGTTPTPTQVSDDSGVSGGGNGGG